MFGNGKVFISHTHEDNDLCDDLIAALDAWQVNYWIDLSQLSAGQELFTHIHQALGERDIFIRACSPAAQRSPWMAQEEQLARSLRAPNRSGRRLMIDLILRPGYQISPEETRDVIIDATQITSDHWVQQLRKTLGIPPRGRNMNRRAFLGVGATSIVALGALGYAGKVALTPPQLPNYLPQTIATPVTAQHNHAPELWHYTFGTGEYDSHGYGLAVNGDSLYGAGEVFVFALNAQDGSLHWANKNLFIGNQIAPAVSGDTLYVLGEDPTLPGSGLVVFALNAQDGTRRWQNTIDQDSTGNTIYNVAPLLMIGDTLVGIYNASVVALDAATGKPHWTQHQDLNQDFISENPLIAAPAVVNGVIYAGLANGNLTAYNLTSGALIWSATHFVGTAGEPIQSTPAVQSGIVYVGRDDGYCYAFDANTGQMIWQQQIMAPPAGSTGGDFFIGSPTVVDGVVYVGGGTSSGLNPAAAQADVVCALDALTGKVIWSVHPSQTVADGVAAYSITGQPLVVGASVYVTALLAPVTSIKRDVVYALALQDGAVQWYNIAPSGVGAGGAVNPLYPSSPVIENSTLYFASTDGTIYALSLA